MNIIKYTFGIELNESSLSYEKFMTHVLPYSIGVNVGVGFENKDINKYDRCPVRFIYGSSANRIRMAKRYVCRYRYVLNIGYSPKALNGN